MTQTAGLKWNGEVAVKRARAGAVRGLKLAAELLLSESNKLVPLDEGTLMHSGRATVDTESLEGMVSYDTPYAVVQHEALDFIHPNGRQAKYLEDAWMGWSPEFVHIIGEQIRRALGDKG
jgi:hypothetical protein